MSRAFSLRSANAGVEDADDGVVADDDDGDEVENHSCLAVVHDGRCREEEADDDDADADADGNGDDDDDDVNGRLRLPPRRRTFLPICPKTILPTDAAVTHLLAHNLTDNNVYESSNITS